MFVFIPHAERLHLPRFPARVDVQTLERALKQAYLMAEWDYVKDNHFAEFAYAEITTAEQAFAFADQLDAHNKRINKPPFDTGCTKARGIRYWLTGPTKHTWTKDPHGVRLALAHNRRTCCGCHETGSYAPRDKW
jgi:hypothetical protein